MTGTRDTIRESIHFAGVSLLQEAKEKKREGISRTGLSNRNPIADVSSHKRSQQPAEQESGNFTGAQDAHVW